MLVDRELDDMVIGATQERTAVAARSFVIWGEELFKKRRYAAAEKLYQRARGLVERNLGQQHPMMAEVLECYSELLLRTNRQAEAIAMKSRSKDMVSGNLLVRGAGRLVNVDIKPRLFQDFPPETRLE